MLAAPGSNNVAGKSTSSGRVRQAPFGRGGRGSSAWPKLAPTLPGHALPDELFIKARLGARSSSQTNLNRKNKTIYSCSLRRARPEYSPYSPRPPALRHLPPSSARPPNFPFVFEPYALMLALATAVMMDLALSILPPRKPASPESNGSTWATGRSCLLGELARSSKATDGCL